MGDPQILFIIVVVSIGATIIASKIVATLIDLDYRVKELEKKLENKE